MENIRKKNIAVEVDGKTIEEAVKKALAHLNVPREQVKITILSEEQKGLFGMQGAKPAKIRVSVISQPAGKKKP